MIFNLVLVLAYFKVTRHIRVSQSMVTNTEFTRSVTGILLFMGILPFWNL